MLMSVEGKHLQPRHGVATHLDRDLTKPDEAPDRADDLEVEQLRRVQHRPFQQETITQFLRPPPEEQVDDDRRVDDDVLGDAPGVSPRHDVAE